MDDSLSIVKYKVSPEDICKLIDIGKEMKANVVVYSQVSKTVIGFAQNFVDANILKTFEEPVKVELSEDFSNIAVMNKDLIALEKFSRTSKFDPYDIYATKTKYNGINDQLIDIHCQDEYRLCYDFKDYIKLYKSIMNEMSHSKKVAEYKDIKSILEFNQALSAKASDGIQHIYYDKRLLFIAPTFINAKKTEVVDMDIYEDKYGNYLINIIIHKKKGKLFNIYRILRL
jgi:hypothetical protein|nr:MAG TPA: hypothetical protein [Caudoviricetes sp.]